MTEKMPPHPCHGYGHCQTCIAGHKPTCCECGDVFVPWHPDIQHLYVSGQMT